MVAARAKEPIKAIATPKTPPIAPNTTASIKNCIKTSLSNAPIAKRTPISRVLSVTLTSMIFIIPIPPTTRLTAATAPKSIVMISVVLETLRAISSVSKIIKLSSSASDKERLSLIKRRILSVTNARSICESTDTKIAETLVFPETLR